MHMYSKIFKNKKNRETIGHANRQAGFTLLEMIIAVGLFAVVATVALGTLLTSTTANRKSKTERIAMDSIGFALDDITQNVRFGGNFDCDTSTPLVLDECSSSEIVLTGAAGTPVYYRRATVSGREAIQRSPDGSSWVTLTDPSVNITGLAFTVRNDVGAVSPHYPRILVRVRGTATNPDTKAQTPFALQTTITKRNAIAQ